MFTVFRFTADRISGQACHVTWRQQNLVATTADRSSVRWLRSSFYSFYSTIPVGLTMRYTPVRVVAWHTTWICQAFSRILFWSKPCQRPVLRLTFSGSMHGTTMFPFSGALAWRDPKDINISTLSHRYCFHGLLPMITWSQQRGSLVLLFSLSQGHTM